MASHTARPSDARCGRFLLAARELLEDGAHRAAGTPGPWSRNPQAQFVATCFVVYDLAGEMRTSLPAGANLPAFSSRFDSTRSINGPSQRMSGRGRKVIHNHTMIGQRIRLQRRPNQLFDRLPLQPLLDVWFCRRAMSSRLVTIVRMRCACWPMAAAASACSAGRGGCARSSVSPSPPAR